MSEPTTVYLVTEMIDLGYHVKSAWYSLESASAECDKLTARFMQKFPTTRFHPPYEVEAVDMEDAK